MSRDWFDFVIKITNKTKKMFNLVYLSLPWHLHKSVQSCRMSHTAVGFIHFFRCLLMPSVEIYNSNALVNCFFWYVVSVSALNACLFSHSRHTWDWTNHSLSVSIEYTLSRAKHRFLVIRLEIPVEHVENKKKNLYDACV